MKGLIYRRFGAPHEVLALERLSEASLARGRVRVAMTLAPINPSDLIPITGAYSHRLSPPQAAGYEGVGLVVEADPTLKAWIGRRVLPLRSGGTWSTILDADPDWLIAVPDNVPDDLAARGYINPLSAKLMLKNWPVAGRRIFLTAAGSSCAGLLASWAMAEGASEVLGLCRSASAASRAKSLGMTLATEEAAEFADIIFDCVGGDTADRLLSIMSAGAQFVSYGLLSGHPISSTRAKTLQRFHLRQHLATLSPRAFVGEFEEIWSRLRSDALPPPRLYPIEAWKEALAAVDEPGRTFKPMLAIRNEAESAA